LEQNR